MDLSWKLLSDSDLNWGGNLVLIMIMLSMQTCHTPTNHSNVWKPVGPPAVIIIRLQRQQKCQPWNSLSDVCWTLQDSSHLETISNATWWHASLDIDSWRDRPHVPVHCHWLKFSLALFKTHDIETQSNTRTHTRRLESVYMTQAITFVVDLIVVQNRHCQMEKDGNAGVYQEGAY